MIRTALSSLIVTLAACGDGIQPGIDAPPSDVPPVTPRAVVVSGSFTPGSTGVMSVLDLDTMTVMERVAPNSAVGSDPMLRAFGDELFVVNRADGNNVTVLDARTFAVVEQLATGASSNPQDVAQVGNKLYVPAMGTAGVVVLTRGSSAAPMTIDLSSLDPDGKPDCISAFAVGNDVYVACGMLDESFVARGPGKVVVIDTATNTPRATVTLLTANPFGLLERMPEANGGALVIGTVPSFADTTMGCVEKIVVGATPAPGGCVVQNQALTSNASRISFQEVGGMTLMWMVISKFGPNGPAGELRAHDIGTNTLWDGSVTPAEQAVGDLVPCSNGKLVIADQTLATNGLRVYEVTVEKTTAPLPIGLAPNASHGLVCN